MQATGIIIFAITYALISARRLRWLELDRPAGALLGSVANIIVAEASRDVGGIGFWAYLRVGVPLALSTTVLGTLWILRASPQIRLSVGSRGGRSDPQAQRAGAVC